MHHNALGRRHMFRIRCRFSTVFAIDPVAGVEVGGWGAEAPLGPGQPVADGADRDADTNTVCRHFALVRDVLPALRLLSFCVCIASASLLLSCGLRRRRRRWLFPADFSSPLWCGAPTIIIRWRRSRSTWGRATSPSTSPLCPRTQLPSPSRTQRRSPRRRGRPHNTATGANRRRF